MVLNKPIMQCSNNHEKVDYISNLPDTLLAAILALLPTKKAVKTSILSRRWKYVWTQIPIIEFHQVPVCQLSTRFREERRIYNAFIGRILFQNEVSCLERFTIKFFICDYESLNVMISWLDVLRWRQYGELNIKLLGDFAPLYLPKEFLCGQRLVVLELDGFCMDDSQDSFHLPNLETVHFGENIVFPSDQFLKKFLLGCSALKNLYILRGCGLRHVYVESSTLTSLDLRNLKPRKNCVYPKHITIKTPKLSYLILHAADLHFDVDDLNLLTEADIYVLSPHTSHGFYDNLAQLIKKVSGTRILRLCILNLSFCRDVLPNFKNLTQLKFTNDGCAYELLKHAPKLKSLIFDNRGQEVVGKLLDAEVVPECLSCLERVEIFWRVTTDIIMVDYFLKKGTALKEMIVNLHDCVSIERGRALYQMLVDIPTFSPVCQIKVLLYKSGSCIVVGMKLA